MKATPATGNGFTDISDGRFIRGGRLSPPESVARRGGSGNDRLFGQDGGDTLHTRDGVRGNDLANGGSDIDFCSTDPEDRKVSC